MTMFFPIVIWLGIQFPAHGKISQFTKEGKTDSIKNVLMIGDSHMVGDFGEYLHRGMHEKGKFNIVSIGIGGAGTYHFSVTMRGFCCGYRIRESCWFDSIPSNSKIPVVEEGYGAENKIVGKFFKGKLANYIAHYEPDIVVIALGSNYTNAHEELMEIIRNGNINREVIWLGPMRRSNIEMRLYAINQVIKKYPDIRFVGSEDLVGHDTITSAHYSGKSAKNWADKLISRMEKHF